MNAQEILKKNSNLFDTPITEMYFKDTQAIITCMEEYKSLAIVDVISHLKVKLEVNAGRLAEPLLKEGKHPMEDEDCHKAFLMLAHLEAIENYIN
jgi:hypothetical protein